MTSALVATMATAPHPAPSLFRFLGLLSLLSFKLPVVHFPKKKKKNALRDLLVVQWLRILLAMQGT